MKTAYIVMGSTGEYSDRRIWAVAVHLDEVKAQEHVTAASARARELEAWISPDGDPWEWAEGEGLPRNEHDPNMQMDGGTRYHIEVAPFVGEP